MNQPVSITQLERDLNAKRAEAEAVSFQLTDGIEREVAEFNSRLAVAPPSDQDHFRTLLEKALGRLDAARASNSRLAALNGEAQRMETALEVARGEQRAIAIEQSNRNMASARSEYAHACKQVIRAWRRLLQLQRVAQNTPGANSKLPRGFHIADLWPMGWQLMSATQTSDHMRDNLLPCESAEQPAEEAA